MKLVITSHGREIALEIRDRRSVPDVLKACVALDFAPDGWKLDEQ